MPVVQSQQPNGDTHPVYEVDLTSSGLLIQIIDESGQVFLIDRFAWDGIIAAVNAEMKRAETAAREWVATHYDPKD